MWIRIYIKRLLKSLRPDHDNALFYSLVGFRRQRCLHHCIEEFAIFRRKTAVMQRRPVGNVDQACSLATAPLRATFPFSLLYAGW
jgi:hypothetical protein